MARSVFMKILAPAMLAALNAFATEEPAQVSTDVPPSAEIKPEDFVYVASTRPDRIGRVMAPVFVNGVGPFAFVVDTGASSSVISPRVVARLKLVADPSRAKLLRGITGSEVVSTVAVESITAGEIMLAKSELPVVEPRVFADAEINHWAPSSDLFIGFESTVPPSNTLAII